MSWSNPEAVESLLKNEEVFWENYCSSQTKNVLKANKITKDSDLFFSFFRIVKRLAELMPNLDHNSPGWSWKKPHDKEVALVVLGKGNFTNRTNKAFVMNNVIGGLFVWNNEICLFGDGISTDEVSFVSKSSELDWYYQHEWRGVEDVRSVFKIPVDLKLGEIPDGHPLHDDHHLAKALKNSDITLTRADILYPVYPRYAKREDEHFSKKKQ